MAAIRVEKNSDYAAVILSNPGKLNALNVAMWTSLTQTLQKLAQAAPLAAHMNKKLVRRLTVQPEPLTEMKLQKPSHLLHHRTAGKACKASSIVANRYF